jgi:complement component 1 Q subcomponent-binding protein
LNCRGAARGASRVTRLFPALSRVAIARSHDLAGMFPAARTGLRRALSRLASARAPSPALDPRARVPSLARVLAAPPIDDRASAVAAVASSRLARAGFRASARGSLSAEEGGASSERADPERGLSRVLGEELEHERTTYTPSEVVTKGPPEPFEIIESDGDCEVTLTRAYGDDEEIAITFNATEDPYDEDDAILPAGADEGDEDEDEDVAIHFLVSVSRGDGEEALEFSCATDGETVEVRNVRYESLADGLEDDAMGAGYLSAYPGPNYDELDESVQEEFHKYLEARGVDAGLARYIMEVHIDKEQKEYTRWLENVSNFVSKGASK